MRLMPIRGSGLSLSCESEQATQARNHRVNSLFLWEISLIRSFF
jgi:hypothetical protein